MRRMQVSQDAANSERSQRVSLLVHERFHQQATERPNAIAVSCGTERLTYAELDVAGERIAARLRAVGVGPETLVALYLERSCRLVAAIVGVLKAGAAYMPLDLAAPPERIRFILDDAQPAVVLSEAKLVEQLPPTQAQIERLDVESEPDQEPSEEAVKRPGPDNAAYVIYTSGSTGRPKGVVVTHRNLARLFTSTEDWFRFGPDDVWTLFHSFAFDFSVWELWGALVHGGRLVVVPFWISRSPEAFHELLRQEQVTVLNQTPSAFRQLIRADECASEKSELRLRWVIFGGEALEFPSLEPWIRRHGDSQPRLINMYGITETTVHVTYRPVTADDVRQKRGSVIGQPIPDLTLHLLDEQQRPCPPGEVGELYVGGAGVARGYLRRADLTAERFIPNPSGGPVGDRLYRSGDLARQSPDGELEYVGRADHQVKIRGFRIELGEIESVLQTHPQVGEAVVLARADASGDKQLVAYLSGRESQPNVEELRAFLREQLPAHMVPARFVFLEHFPLTLNGKLDRAALPEPKPLRPDLGTPYRPPTTAPERLLASIWEEELGIEGIGVDDNFFALGGDSIRSIRVLAQAQRAGLSFSLEQLFQQPTIAELLRSGQSKTDEPSRRLSVFALVEEIVRARLPADIEDAYPMAKLQVGMFFHNQLQPESAVFHDVFSFRLQLRLDRLPLRSAVRHLAARHAIFRTSFDLGTHQQPLQLVHQAVEVPLTAQDLRGQTAAEQRAALVRWVEEEKRRRFDWEQAPLLRLHVQHLTDDSFQFIVSFHHAIMDGWSLAAMVTELFQEYAGSLRGAPPLLAPPEISYRDFVVCEKQAAESEDTRRFWQRQMDQAALQPLPRWPVSFRHGGTEQVRGPEIEIEPEILAGLQRLAQRVGVPLRSVLLTAHCAVLRAVTGQSQVLTGLVANGRPQAQGGERLIGLFLNTVPFRPHLTNGSWESLVQQTFRLENEILPHRRCPLSDIQQLGGGQPLFETVFDFVQFHVYQDVPGFNRQSFLEDHYFEANNFVFYVTFMLDATGSKLQMHFDYDPNELCPPQIEALCTYFVEALRLLANAPAASHQAAWLLPEPEKARLLTDWNQTAQTWPEATVTELISEQANRTPERPALAFGDVVLTYRELDQITDGLAARLLQNGVQPGDLVGLHLPRSHEMLLAVLGVLKAGAAYAPLDPSYPSDRLDFMIEDAELKIILTDDSLPKAGGNAPARQLSIRTLLAGAPSGPAAPWLPKPRPEDLAYVIYTSGSTGRPKGVAIPHRALTNFLRSMQREPSLSPEDTLLAVTTLSFDIAALELFLPLTVGARVVVASRETSLDPTALAEALEMHGITVLQATPTTWRLLVDSGWTGPGGRVKALCGGEALSRDLANQLLERCREVWNMYGPTETTVWSCCQRVQAGSGPVPIGRPISNTQIYLLDANHRPVPTGSEGEIFVGGTGLARGYWRRPELTAERFVPDPFQLKAGARLYRTGDLGRYLPDGSLLCLGRTDHQVKLRGVRIELGEIEAALLEHPAVSAAVVSVRGTPGKDQALVGYYTVRASRRGGQGTGRPTGGSTDGGPTIAELKARLEKRLPPALLPSHLVELDAFPLTPNGKVDRNQLPEPGGLRPELPTPFVPPESPLEMAVAGIWQEVLRVDRVGLEDNFFELGGHSLLAIQVMARLRHQLNVELSLATLFEQPRLGDFSLHVVEALLERENHWLAAASTSPETPPAPRTPILSQPTQQ